MIGQAQDRETVLSLWRRHVAIADALAEVLNAMGVQDEQTAGVPDRKLLPAPVPKKRKRRSSEPIIHDIEGTDVEVTQLQSDILDVLNAAPGTDPAPILAKTIAEKIGGITPHGVNYAIKDLRERMAKAGCKAEINGYRGRGFALEIERGEE